ncbi:MAG: hypothetical protein RMK18_04120 [Armatimonadota bacterium]|nr:hypothetical protein [Armatimonadota bacterium]MCX7777208.1 hypothetical protein [Armatimonadota bacterium]MDW8025035.1 hypothetical protein [Armatimonadota bacterium]
MRKGITVIIVLALIGLAFNSIHAQLGRVIKGAAIVFIVKQFGKQINDGINAVLLNRKWEHRKATKVVPIFSIGSGAYVGAAQVIGDEERVKEVEAVAQIEVNLPGEARAKVLIPVDRVSLNITEIKRVYDVGVSAVIDIKL